MRITVAALASFAGVAMAGCAGSPAAAVAYPPAGAAPAPHPIVAEAAPAGDETPQQPRSEHAARQMNRAVGWVVLSVGAEATILATVTSFMMLHENGVRSDNCVDKVCSPEGVAANGKLGDLAGWNAAAWGVAAVGLGVGAFLLLTNPSDRSLGAQVGVAPTATGSALLLRGSF